MPTTTASKKKGPVSVVIVTWLDACSRDIDVEIGARQLGDEILGCVQNTVGYLIKKNDRWVVLAMDWGINSAYRTLFEIPRCLVKSIKVLHCHEKKSKKVHTS